MLKKKIILESKKKIQDRLLGKYSADYGYITKSPFGLNGNLNIKKRRQKIFVIATHDFVDAPHALGNSIFPDFYQWFLYLCEISKKQMIFGWLKIIQILVKIILNILI